MKKLLILLLIATLVIAGSVFAFTDGTDEVICELEPDVLEKVLAIKAEFLKDMVDGNLLSQDEADALNASLANQEQHDTLRELGFGEWLRTSEYADDMFELMPHKGMRGNRFADLTEEEIAALRANCEDGDFPQGFGMGRYGEDGQYSGDRPMHGKGHRMNRDQ